VAAAAAALLHMVLLQVTTLLVAVAAVVLVEDMVFPVIPVALEVLVRMVLQVTLVQQVQVEL
jgi:hypothetical protein